jgi:hypothetical protein
LRQHAVTEGLDEIELLLADVVEVDLVEPELDQLM